MINHCTKSPLRTHKDMSPGARQLLCAHRMMIYSQSGRLHSAPLSDLNQKMPSWQRGWRTCEKLQCGHVSPTTVPAPLLPLSVAIMAVRSVTCSINHPECRFVYPPGVGRGLKQQYLFLQLFTPMPLLISAFQIYFYFILLICCPQDQTFLQDVVSTLLFLVIQPILLCPDEEWKTWCLLKVCHFLTWVLWD